MSRCPRLVTLKNSLAAQHAKSAPCCTPLPSFLSPPPSLSSSLFLFACPCQVATCCVHWSRPQENRNIVSCPNSFRLIPHTPSFPPLHTSIPLPSAMALANPPLVSCTHRQRCLSEAKRVSTSTYECHNKTIYSATHSPYPSPQPLSLYSI